MIDTGTMDAGARRAMLRGWADTIPAMQIAVYVMAGGGLLGRMAAEQPADFYIDDRARSRYTKRETLAAVSWLVDVAEAAGLNPRDLPAMPRMPNMGCF